MHKLKSSKLYFFSILNLFVLSFRNFYFKSNFYNKKLITFIPNRIFYKPSTQFSTSLSAVHKDFYKITNISSELLWESKIKDKQKFENLHSFLWLSNLDRKNSKDITKSLIKSWIDNFFNYNSNTWKMEITARRIIAWASNIDITLENSGKEYKEIFLVSILKQSNFILNNLKNVSYSSSKIICCAAIILSGVIFKENSINYKIGVKELEKVIKNYFDESGFPKSRNPEEVFISIKYLILIREWFMEAQKPIPDFLNEIIRKCGSCYMMLSCANKQFPLFNGATEINHKDYDIFLKNFKYKFTNNNHELASLIKVKKKRFELFIDCGDAPADNFSKLYQAGCLSFELISNKQKVICNLGYGKYLSNKLNLLSRSTAAHSTLYINDTSSCSFGANKYINKMYNYSLVNRHKILERNYVEDRNFYLIGASHNGYEKKFGCIHKRSIKILKDEDKILGKDELKRKQNHSDSLVYFIRFYIYPNTKIVKTKAGNSILISLSNGEGWLLQSEANDFKIERSIFLANKNKVISNESISINGNINNEVTTINWSIERVS
jgi:uncharacterized heparinase superfamily protein